MSETDYRLAESKGLDRLRTRALNNSPAIVAGATLLLLLTVYWSVDSHAFTSASMGSLANSGAGFGMAAVGEAIIVLVGGLDLSVGSILSLLNVLLVTQMGTSPVSQVGTSIEILLVGIAVSGVNGLLVVGLDLPPILVTLATLFLWQGVALLVMTQPSGAVAPSFMNALSGSAFLGIPNCIYVLLGGAAIWAALRRTGWIRSLYAVGADRSIARANGVRVKGVMVGSYALAGFFYGVGALLLTAVSGGGDPNIGSSMLITTFAAVVLGGTALGGGRGHAAAAIIGAFIVTVISDILFALKVPVFYTDIVDGSILLLAVVVGALLTTGRSLFRGLRIQS